jgi:hypothetical protein
MSIPLELVGLKLKIRKHNISKRRFTFTYDFVVFPWLIWEIGQRGGRFDLQEVELSFLSACWVDRPRPLCGLSARRGSTGFSLCSLRVFERFHFDLFSPLFLAGRSEGQERQTREGGVNGSQ